MTILLGVDTGGTFTDFVLYQNGELKTHKVLSTPHAPEEAILQGITELGLSDLPVDTDFYVVHGSTVATNAVLEGKGVRTVFITNRGLADMLSIARQTRPELYNLQPRPVAPPVDAELCLETGGRLSARAEVVDDLTDADLQALLRQVEVLAPRSVAINLLFSYLDERFEKAIAGIMPEDVFVSRSSKVLPEFREYERGMTTWLNAYVGPLVEGYIHRLQQGARHAVISVMQSSGGTIAADQAGADAVHMLLSGPAGGLAAAKFMGDIIKRPRLLTFDMGGTSTDVAMIDRQISLTSEGHIGDYPVAIPMVDMHTIGAGGGSIASVDAGGLLQVGPESAGATPGPACYGQGGTQATVTDANLVLGRLRADAFLGGGMRLDEIAAQKAVGQVAAQLGLSTEEAAQGIIRIANEHMAQALRVMSVQRGVDARELTLASFGGAGGLHVCALADALGMQQAGVPVYAGVLSALGMLVAPRGRQLSRTMMGLLDDFADQDITAGMAQLNLQGQQALAKEGVAAEQIDRHYSLDLRYQGQSYYLNVPWQNKDSAGAAFHKLHARRYGHQLNLPLELVNIRLALSKQAEPFELKHKMPAQQAMPQQHVSLVGVEQPAAVYNRNDLQTGQNLAGPLLITETISTTFVDVGWQASVHESGSILLRRVEA